MSREAQATHLVLVEETVELLLDFLEQGSLVCALLLELPLPALELEALRVAPFHDDLDLVALLAEDVHDVVVGQREVFEGHGRLGHALERDGHVRVVHVEPGQEGLLVFPRFAVGKLQLLFFVRSEGVVEGAVEARVRFADDGDDSELPAFSELRVRRVEPAFFDEVLDHVFAGRDLSLGFFERVLLVSDLEVEHVFELVEDVHELGIGELRVSVLVQFAEALQRDVSVCLVELGQRVAP